MGNDPKLTQLTNQCRSSLASPVYVPPTVTIQPSRSGDTLSSKHILGILQKNWRFSLLVTLIFLATVTLGTLLMEDVYEPKARVEIEPQAAPEDFSLRDLPNSVPTETEQQDYLQTQIELLKSDALAIAVIQTLHLDRNGQIVGAGQQSRLKSSLIRTLHLDRLVKPPEKNGLEIALRDFHDRLSVTQVRNSRLVQVSFAASEPKLAAQITNTLVNLYVERSQRTHYEATIQAAEWLSGELNDLRRRVEQANQALVNYQSRNGIQELSDPHDGASSKQNPATQRLAELNRQLTQAQSDRIQMEAFMNMIQAGSTDSLPQMRDNPVLQDLTKRFAEARAQLAQGSAVYGKNNPNVKKLQSLADELEAQLAAERERIVRQVKTGYEVARGRELLLTQALSQMKGTVDLMNEKMIRYNLLKREAQASLDLYNTLFARLKEAPISAGLKSTNIRVTDQARILDKPTKPHRLEIINVGLVFGIFAGVALGFLKESFDDTVRTPDDIKALTGLPSLAMLPVTKPIGKTKRKALNGSASRFYQEKPRSAEAEAMRSLQASIRVCSMPAGDPIRVILLVSPFPNEGKTTVAVNLAMALAQHGKTCLLDADLRRPAVARTFGLAFSQGLEAVLAGSVSLGNALQDVSDVPNLTVLPAGRVSPNPGALVGSEPMREVLRMLRERFSYVVIDSPPIIPYADARFLLSLVDGVVLVARCGLTPQQAIIWSNEMLAEVHAPVLGVLLNGVDRKSRFGDCWYGSDKFSCA